MKPRPIRFTKWSCLALIVALPGVLIMPVLFFMNGILFPQVNGWLILAPALVLMLIGSLIEFIGNRR